MSRVAEDSYCHAAGLRVGDKLVSVTTADSYCMHNHHEDAAAAAADDDNDGGGGGDDDGDVVC